jgi:hypothetical protein
MSLAAWCLLVPSQGVGFSVCAGLLNTLTALTHLRVAYHIPRTRAHALWVGVIFARCCSPLPSSLYESYVLGFPPVDCLLTARHGFVSGVSLPD